MNLAQYMMWRGPAAAPPSPPQPAPGPLPSFALTSASAGTKPFTLGHEFKIGAIPAGQVPLVAGGQATIKNVWPDGSAKIAIIAGTTALAAATLTYLTFTKGSDPGGAALTTAALKATGIAAVVSAGSYGNATFATTDWDSPFVNWVAGPVMSSWVYRKQIGSDAHLVAWLEVRLFATGDVEVLPWVENGYLMVAAPDVRTAAYGFTLGGTSRFSGTFTVNSHTRMPLVSGAITSHWLGTAHDVIIKKDGSYIQSTELTPAYGVQISPTAPTIATLPTTFTPQQAGMWDSSLAGGGFHNHVCVLPHWEALYLTSTAPETYKGTIFQAYSACRYDWNYRDETTNRAMLFADQDQYLNIHRPTTDVGWTSPPLPPSAPDVEVSMSIDHQPSLGYFAYLLTGRWFFVDMAQQVAAWNYLTVPAQAWRQGRTGIMDSRNLQVRGMAWAWRAMAQVICITPDADTAQRNQYIAQLQNNIAFVNSTWVANNDSPQGWIPALGQDAVATDYNEYSGNTLAGSTTTVIKVSATDMFSSTSANNQFIGFTLTLNGETRTITASNVTANTLTVGTAFSSAPAEGVHWVANDGVNFDAPWMQDYHVAVLGHLKDLRLPLGSTALAALETYWLWKVQTTTGRMGSATDTNKWCYRDCAPYAVAVAPTDHPSHVSPRGPFYSTWGEMYTATFKGSSTDLKPMPYANPGARVDGPIRTADMSHTSQFCNFMRGCAYAVKYDAPGAAVGWALIKAASNFDTFRATMEAEGWAQGALAPSPIPAYSRGQAINEWREIPGSALYPNTPPTNIVYDSLGGQSTGGGNNYDAQLNAWSGWSLDTRTGKGWLAWQGGHGDFYGNQIDMIDLAADVPRWVEYVPATTGNQANLDPIPPAPDATDPIYGRYKDGTIPSRHPYYGPQFLERQDRALSLGGSFSPHGGFFELMDAFNVRTKAVDARDTFPAVLGGAYGGWTSAGQWSTCKDPRDECIYVTYGSQLRRFTPAAVGSVGGTWANVGPLPNNINTGALGMTAVDTKRNRLYWCFGYATNPNQPAWCDLATGIWTEPTVPASAAKTELEILPSINGPERGASPLSLGIVYVPQLDKFLVRGAAAGGKVFAIDPVTYGVSYLTTTGGDAIPNAFGYEDQQGIFNRWSLWNRGIYYVPSASASVYYLRLW